MAARSEGLAGLSQTVLLIFGFGGLLIAMGVLGVTAVVRGWAPKLALLATVAIAAGIVVVGVITSGPVFWITIAALPLLWALTFGLILAVRGSFTPKSPAHNGTYALPIEANILPDMRSPNVLLSGRG